MKKTLVVALILLTAVYAGASQKSKPFVGSRPGAFSGVASAVLGSAVTTISTIYNVDGTTAWTDTVSSTAGSVARALSATYISAAGIVVEVGPNVARATPDGLLIEPESTNLVEDSDRLDAAIWTPSKLAVSTAAIAAPMAGQYADGLVGDSDTDLHYLISNGGSFAVTPGEVLWVSAFAKAGAQAVQGFAVVFVDGGSSAFSAIYSSWTGAAFTASGDWYPAANDIDAHGEDALAGGWYRYSAQITVPATAVVGLTVLLPGGAMAYAGDGVNAGGYFWGVQVEKQNWMGSLVRTSGGAATRPVDAYTMATPAALSTAAATTGTGTIVYKAQIGQDISALGTAMGLFSIQDSPVGMLSFAEAGTKYIHSYSGAQSGFLALPALVADTAYWFCTQWTTGSTFRTGYRVSGGDWTYGATKAFSGFTDTGTAYLGHTPSFPLTVETVIVLDGVPADADMNTDYGF